MSLLLVTETETVSHFLGSIIFRTTGLLLMNVAIIITTFMDNVVYYIHSMQLRAFDNVCSIISRETYCQLYVSFQYILDG